MLDGPWWIIVAAVFGLVIGSFLNVVIHRLPRMLERLAQGMRGIPGDPTG